MLTSIVSSNASKIKYVGFIEPCYSQEYGGGSGEAYLVLGSKRSLSVVDLLTMKTLWTVEGRFTTFAVAKDDATSSAAATNGWIACGMASFDETKDQAPDGVNKAEDLDEKEFHLAVFSYTDSIPIIKRKMNAKITSIEYCHVGMADESTPALVVLSTNGEINLVHQGEEIQCKGKVARLHRTTLPQLPAALLQSSLAFQVENNDLSNVPSSEPRWLERYLDAESSNISSVASIYKDFMLNFLPKVAPSSSTQENIESEEPPIQWDVDTKKDSDEVSPQEANNTERLNRIRAAARSVFLKSEEAASVVPASQTAETESSRRSHKRRKETLPEAEPVKDADQAEPAKKRSSSRKKSTKGSLDYVYG